MRCIDAFVLTSGQFYFICKKRMVSQMAFLKQKLSVNSFTLKSWPFTPFISVHFFFESYNVVNQQVHKAPITTARPSYTLMLSTTSSHLKNQDIWNANFCWIRNLIYMSMNWKFLLFYYWKENNFHHHSQLSFLLLSVFSLVIENSSTEQTVFHLK